MAMSIAASTNGLTAGGCACCDSSVPSSKLTKSLRSVFQKFPSSGIRAPAPAPLSNSNRRSRRCKGPRSALDDADYEARDNSPKKAEEGPNARPLPGYKKPDKPQGAQNALARALAYRQAKESAESSGNVKKVDKPPAPERPKDVPEVEIFRGQNFQSRLQSTDASPSSSDSSSPSSVSDPTPSASSAYGDGETASKAGKNEASPSEGETVSHIRPQGPSAALTLDVGKVIEEKLGAASVSKIEASTDKTEQRAAETSFDDGGVKSTVSLDVFMKAQAYKQQQDEMTAALKEKPSEPTATMSSTSTSTSATGSGSGENLVEVEIVTRDGVIRKLVSPEKAFTNVKEFRRTGVSSIDFAGLGFADKKQGGRAVVREDYQAPPPGALPEVEILTKDAEPDAVDGEENDLYKPRVSTWGVFPRPADISKAYGGGRTIRPGDTLETEEERIAREAKTQKLLADYKKKMGLDVDPRVKAECERIMKRGDSLMDSGDLKGALALFESVMEKMTFQSELHGLAALQGAICLDSLARFNEARETYEKLISHPNGKIRKQAKQLLYGFRAMENLKVSTSNKWDTSVYAKYFEAFADGYNTNYKASEDETSKEKLREQTLAYALLLFFPILLVVVLALSKGARS
ncbi:hypothetical protein Mapa_001688 [Marchantia paleacea]|nr:hypothetical protein Mapa_001688 [Marchantia paleacea]